MPHVVAYVVLVRVLCLLLRQWANCRNKIAQRQALTVRGQERARGACKALLILLQPVQGRAL
jgi:hypothetical protein